MKFYSTNDKNYLVGLNQAALSGIAPGGGLYFPQSVVTLSEELLSKFKDMSFPANAG